MPPEKDKIKRAILWLRKSFEIIERTDVPDRLLADVRPTVDVLGWENLLDVDHSINTGTNVVSISSAAVPDNVIRLVLEASVETSNSALAFDMWIEHSALTNIAVMRPVSIPIAPNSIVVGMERVIYLLEGDSMRGRCAPATGVGETLTMRTRFVDLPIGEYIHGF